MGRYKPEGKVKHIRCRYCGAQLRRDAIGQRCLTINCKWERGLPENEDTPTKGSKPHSLEYAS